MVRNRPAKLTNPDPRGGVPKPAEIPVIAGKKQADWAIKPLRPARARVKASKNPENCGSPEFLDAIKAVGTEIAIKRESIGSAISRAATPERRGRRSTHLGRKEVENIRAAAVFTLRKHRKLNRFTTIHFDAAGIVDPVRAVGQLMKLANDWLRTKGEALTYIWVRENGDGKGDHVHILWAIPPALAQDFAKRERGWRRLIGAKRRARAFKSEPIGLNLRHGEYEIQYGRDYRCDLHGVLDYVLKGATPKTAKALGLPYSGSGGELWGKRSGMSENINRAARARRLK